MFFLQPSVPGLRHSLAGRPCERMRLGDISLHFHLLYDPGTNHCSTLGLSFSFCIMDRKGCDGLLGVRVLVYCPGNQRAEGGGARLGLSQKPNLAYWGFLAKEGTAAWRQAPGSKPLLGPMDWTTVHWAVLLPVSLPTRQSRAANQHKELQFSPQKCSRKGSLPFIHSAIQQTFLRIYLIHLRSA